MGTLSPTSLHLTMALGNKAIAPAETQPVTGASRTMKVAAIAAATLLVCAVVALAMVNVTVETQELAAKKSAAKSTAKALSYGSTITLMNPYNMYLLTQQSGAINMGGFLHGNNNVKIVSPAGKKGAVKFGDDVSLMGANGKYFLVRYSGKVAAHASVIARDTKFKVVGGSGDVHIADRVSFKSEFGYLRASDDGCRSVETLTAGEKFLVGLPGQENGLKRPTVSTTVRLSPSRTWMISSCRPTTTAGSPFVPSRLATGTTSPSSAPSMPKASSRTVARLFSVHTTAAWCPCASTTMPSRLFPCRSATEASLLSLVLRASPRASCTTVMSSPSAPSRATSRLRMVLPVSSWDSLVTTGLPRSSLCTRSGTAPSKLKHQ